MNGYCGLSPFECGFGIAIWTNKNSPACSDIFHHSLERFDLFNIYRPFVPLGIYNDTFFDFIAVTVVQQHVNLSFRTSDTSSKASIGNNSNIVTALFGH